MSEITLNYENFRAEVLESDKPVLVDFWAEWCGPCKMLAPVIKEIAIEMQSKIKVGKVNVDEEPQLADSYAISSIPTIILIKNGKAVFSSIGYRSKKDIVEMIEKSL